MHDDGATPIAEALFEMLVLERRDDDDTARQLHVPEPIRPRLRAKLLVYREAAVLLALVLTSRVDPKFDRLRAAFEDLVRAGQSGHDPEDRLETVRLAMEDVSEICLPGPDDRGQFHWSMRWLQELGCHETNPATLGYLAFMWGNEFRTALGAMSDLQAQVHELPA